MPRITQTEAFNLTYCNINTNVRSNDNTNAQEPNKKKLGELHVKKRNGQENKHNIDDG